MNTGYATVTIVKHWPTIILIPNIFTNTTERAMFFAAQSNSFATYRTREGVFNHDISHSNASLWTQGDGQ
jgi:hypothetical protein